MEDDARPPRILVVDDSPANLTAVEAALGRLEVDLVKAGSGEEALWRLLSQDFALILLDVAMPGMDGFETAARIRQRDRHRRTPIVFLTAHRIPANVVRGYAVGASDYLEKPVDADVLREKVASYLRSAAGAPHESDELVATILVVQDRPERAELEAVLAGLGQNITARSGEEAFALLQRENVAVVVLDVVLPGATGFETAAAIHNHPKTRDVPVILVSALESAADAIARGYAAGAVDFVFAPVEPHVLRTKVSVFADLWKKRKLHERLAAERGALILELERANRELEALARELDSFSYSVSHDLRAPLRHIEGFAQLLREDAGPNVGDKGVHHIDVIVRSTRRMGLLIDALLQFARLGRASLSERPVRLGPLVEEVVAEAAAMAPGRRIEWTVGALPVVLGDAALLRVVFVNLVGNAVKFTQGTDPAHVRVSARAGEEGHAVVSVADDGAGFDLARAEKLFGAFQRFHTAAEFEGTGIGLATVQRIVHRHGGRVWAEAAPGAGATFFVSLPAVQP